MATYGGGYGGTGFYYTTTDPTNGKGGQGGGEGQNGQAGYASSGSNLAGSAGGAGGAAGTTGSAGVAGGAGGGGFGGTNSGGEGGGGGGGAGYSGAGANLTGSYSGGNGGSGGSGGSHSGGSGGKLGGGGGGGRGGSGAEVNASNSSVSGSISGGVGGTGGVGNTDGQGGLGGYGVDAAEGTALTNTSTGVIRGGDGGYSFGGGGGGGAGFIGRISGGLTNQGSITGGTGGDASAFYSGGAGGYGAVGGSETIDNSGVIRGGQGGAGYQGGLGGAGVVTYGNTTTNEAGGKIFGGTGGYSEYSTSGGGAGARSSGQGGAGARSSNAIVANSGKIVGGDGGYASGSAIGVGAGGAGVVATGGSVRNYANASIKGGGSYGVAGAGVAASGTTILNAGAISGGGGNYSSVGGAGISGSNLTIVDTATVAGGYASTGVQADAFTLTGTNSIALAGTAGAAGTTGISGAVDVQSGTLTFNQALIPGNAVPDAELDAQIIGAGAIVKQATGTLTLTGANTFSGGTTVQAGTLVLGVADVFATDGTLASGGAGTGAITFDGTGDHPATLALTMAAQPGSTMAQPSDATFGNTLDDFGANDALDLQDLTYGGTTSPMPLTVSNGVLSVTEGTTTERFRLADVPAGTTYYAHQDSAGTGTVVDTVCFAAGTLIRTVAGDVAVEKLAIGDFVVTASGETRSVKWMGRQTIVSAFADPIRSFPIRIAAGAIDDNVPARDLFLSPDHALVIDDVLVQAGALVNGTTVARVANPGERFTYHHIETADHAVILAEGTPAETFVSNVTRRTFDNYAEWESLFGLEYAAEPIDELEQPRAMSQRQVPRPIRARLAARAAALGWCEAA